MASEQKKLCFVVGPIGDGGSEPRTHADWLLQGIIGPVFAESFPDFEVLRADQIRAPGDINSQIITRLMDAELVIADMSLHNANAFYELAIRHMVRKPTIHMIDKGWKIPFDVAPYRAIHFSRKEYSDLTAARAELASVVREVIQPGFNVENPVTHARAKFALDEHATPEVKAIASEVDTLREQMREQMGEIQRKLTLLARVTSFGSVDAAATLRPSFEKPASQGLGLADLGKPRVHASGILSALFTEEPKPDGS